MIQFFFLQPLHLFVSWSGPEVVCVPRRKSLALLGFFAINGITVNKRLGRNIRNRGIGVRGA